KRENIIFGDDGRPYLVDFQVCFVCRFSWMGTILGARRVLQALMRLDLCNFSKHVKRQRADQWRGFSASIEDRRPCWLHLHRFFAAPLRQLRGRLPVARKVRAEQGGAASEVFAEDAFRRERAIAASS